ncbi:MAG: metallophosphoesterase family protein [Candidatus Tectomicrobia bacterium]|uniref:Metallophosphoesterase family protein n=1 Tax=Tectimicrobiota bacterium TaxID=2528274 RepID=A0A938B4Q2_UNCTE|nr:metallophosphoesterase family protein [Candidatus Tectomicrobia bacterium]
MKYAVISDLHANLEALEAVLADMEPYADVVVCLGDIVGYNANPNECLEIVQRVCDVVIAGNHDQAACDIRLYDDFSEYAREAMHWTRAQLAPSWKQYLERLPDTAVFGERWLAAHGSPRDTDEYLFHELHFQEIFTYLAESLPDINGCFIGHTHLPMIWECTPTGVVAPATVTGLKVALHPQHRYIINPGSVGQPRYGDPASSYVLLDDEARTVEFRFVQYDIATTQDKIYDAMLPLPLAERLALGQ